MHKTIAEIDRLDALWASSNTGNEFCASLPWEEISKVLRAAVAVTDGLDECGHYHNGEYTLVDALEALGK